MKKTFHSIKTLLASGLLLATLGANAQTQTGLYNWPQNVDYAFGYKPSSAKDSDAKTAYDFWKANFLTDGATCGGSGAKRVKFDKVSGRFGLSDNTSVTVSEGIAYGMLLAAYADEKGNFDALFKFYKANVNGNGIMNWGINTPACNAAPVGKNGATDAELDVAWALWVAHNQWGGGTTSQYLTDAKTLIKAIKDHEIDKTGNLNTLKPGDQFGGHAGGANDLVNPSYFSPAYYRTFGIITNDEAFWTSVYNRGYDIIEKITSKNSTGLVPDWSTSTGTTPASGASGYDDGGVNFFYDAVRTPVRTALDFLWYGDEAPRALAYTKKVNNWLRSKHPNPSSIGSKYALDGTVLQSFHNNSFVGPFTVSSMATDDINTGSYINSLYKDNVATNPTTAEYFNSSWKVISLFIATGNFYLPPPDLCDGPSLEPATHLCQGTGTPKTITLNSFLDGASKYEWKKDGAIISGATSKTYAVSVPGNYEVTTTVTVSGKPCVRRAGTVVYAATPTAKFSFVRSGLAVDFKNTSTGGDPYADPKSLTSAWKFDNLGTTATPATSTESDGATNYSTSGLKVVSLTVTNVCGNTSTYTEQLPLPTATGPGWFGTDFTNQTQGLFGAYSAPNVPNTSVTFDYSACQFAVAKIAKTMVQDKTVALTFKGGPKANGDNPIDVSAYPYARFRIKLVPKSPATTLNIATLLPNGLRVDLVDTSFKATGGVQANLVYLRGPRKADGGYDPIPVNEWFVSTLSFEGKLSNINPKVVLQLAFTPYNDLPLTSSAREDYEIHVDWATVGNKDIPKPSPILTSGNAYVCSTSPTYPITGGELDSCNAEKVIWADGYTKFSRILGPGTYTVDVSNFAGTESRTITIASTEPAVAKLSYTVVAAAPNASIQPYDNSTGKISRWYWHRTTSATGTTSANTLAGYNATTSTLLYSVTTATTQTPEPTPAPGRKASVTYTGAASEYLCLSITPQVSGCVTTAKTCVLIDWTITSTEETLTESTFAIYPTVVTDNRLNVQLGTGLQGAYEIQVMNVNGKQVATSKAISGNNEITLDSNLPAGTYIVKVSQGDKTITKRFIKQ